MIKNLSYEQKAAKYQFKKHIWEGWDVRAFIDYLEDDLDRMMEYGSTYAEPTLKTKEEIKQWIRGHLPYTTKAHKEVSKYFIDKYDGMPVAPWWSKDGSTTLKLK